MRCVHWLNDAEHLLKLSETEQQYDAFGIGWRVLMPLSNNDPEYGRVVMKFGYKDGFYQACLATVPSLKVIYNHCGSGSLRKNTKLCELINLGFPDRGRICDDERSV